MAKFERGINYFTKGVAEVRVSFPENKISCQYCSLFLRYEENFKRYSCRLTGEWLPFPFDKIGENCPVIIEKKEE